MVTKEILDKYFTYDPDSGELTRKIARANQKAGSIPGYIDDLGYRAVSIHKKLYRVHRLIFLIMGENLPEVVDHINGDKLDNRWINLRPTNRQGNNQNCKGKGSNTGIKGVYLDKSGKYEAAVWINGKKLRLGRYDCLQEAEQAVILGRDRYHRSFANHKN